MLFHHFVDTHQTYNERYMIPVTPNEPGDTLIDIN